jgi:hypothetical protein
MSAKFTFAVDHAHGLVRISMTGFYTEEDLVAFCAARRDAHAELGTAPNMHLTLNDLRGMKIQGREIVQAFQDMLSDPAYRSRKLAFVTDANLVRSQLMRSIAGREDARCFASIAEAEDWLLSNDAAIAWPRRVSSGG